MRAYKNNGKEELRMRSTYIVIVLLFLSAPVLCRAEIIQIGFSGLVDYVDDQYNLLENGVQVGSSISGYYIYDSETPDSAIESDVGLYEYFTSPYGISVTSGSLTFQTDWSNVDFSISIVDGIPSGGSGDRYGIISYNNLYINTDIYVEPLSWGLTDFSYTAISSTELPVVPPELSLWQNGNDLYISGGRGGTPPCFDEPFYIHGYIDSVWLVPEPATMLMFCLGGLLLRKRC